MSKISCQNKTEQSKWIEVSNVGIGELEVGQYRNTVDAAFQLTRPDLSSGGFPINRRVLLRQQLLDGPVENVGTPEEVRQ